MADLRRRLSSLDDVAFGRTTPTRGQRAFLVSVLLAFTGLMASMVIILMVALHKPWSDLWPEGLFYGAGGLVLTAVMTRLLGGRRS